MKRGPKAGFAQSPMSKPEAELNFQLRAAGIEAVREHRFHVERRWRFDFALPRYKIGIEVHGGTWSGGRHVRGAGFEKDCEKAIYAALDGWLILPLTPAMIKRGEALQYVQWAIVERGKALRDAA